MSAGLFFAEEERTVPPGEQRLCGGESMQYIPRCRINIAGCCLQSDHISLTSYDIDDNRVSCLEWRADR